MGDLPTALKPEAIRDFPFAFAVLSYLRWADFQEAELEAIAVFDGTIYEPALPTSLHWRTWYQLPPDDLLLFLTEHLPTALYKLSNSRHNPLATHLHRLAGSMGKLSNFSAQSLAALVKWLAEQPFETPSDRQKLLAIFDSFFDISNASYFDIFKTPSHIARLMVELAAPVAGESVYDPCFGSADLLTSAFFFSLSKTEQNGIHYGENSLIISGVERNELSYIIGLSRMVLAGIDDPQIELSNSLERTPPNNPQQDGFDVVLANPPFGMRTKLEALNHFIVSTSDAVGLYIQHALANLKPTGRAVIVVPQGFLFRGGPEKKLRQYLLEQNTVEVVVALPVAAFIPYTGIKTSILVLQRGGTTKQIRMVDAEPFFERGKGRQPASISESQSRELAEKVRNTKTSECCWDIDADTLAETGFDLTPRRRDQSGLNVVLDALRSSIPLVQLKDCCQIMIGRSIRSADLVDEPPRIPMHLTNQQSLFEETSVKSRQQSLFSTVEPIPYIRIKDINKGQANKGSSWISAEAAVGLEGGWKLRAGDVLLSKSGTIGKVGIVRNGAVGAVAANGLYVLHTDGTRLDPHYLAAYLDSGDCRAWLMNHATGGGISHLRRQIIEEIPVPLPPLQMQQRVAAEYREHGVDVLAYLMQLFTGGERDPVTEWVEKELKRLPIEVDSITDPLKFTLLDELSTNIRSLHNELTGSTVESPLAPWFLVFNEAVFNLRGVSKVPLCPGLLNVLQESIRVLKQAEAAIKGHLPNEGKARTLTGIVSKWLVQSCSKLLDMVQIILTADTAILCAGEAAEIALKVQNKGPLPLREIEVSTVPDWGHGELGYLAENASTEFNLRVLAPKLAGPLMLTVHWSALALDGRQVEGTREIPFEVMTEVSNVEARATGLVGSPYITGDPIQPKRNDVFFGRDDLIEQIRRQIVQSGNVVLLEGNRRAGKSSILRHLEGVGPVPGWLGVYCSFQSATGDKHKTGIPTVEVFRLITEAIARSVYKYVDKRIFLPNGDMPPQGERLTIDERRQFAKTSRDSVSEGSAFSDFCSYVEFILDELQTYNLRLLIMLDEFDKLQEGIDNKVTSPQVPENIRYMVQTYPSFSAILTGSHRLKRLREEYWSALFGLGTRFGVTSLTHDAASKLVTEPVKGQLNYSRESMERVISLTNGQPYLLQCLCNRIFDMAAQLKIRSVTLDLVEQAGNLLAENNEHFSTLWGYARSDRRRFILGLIHKEEAGPDPMRFGVLLELLSTHGIEVSDETLIEDLEFLRELEMVELVDKTGSGHYALSIPLMGRWIGRQHDFEVIKKKARIETEDQNG